MNANAVSALSFAKDINEMTGSHIPQSFDPTRSFSSYLKNSVVETNGLLNTSDQKNMEVAMGHSENLHDAMISFEKAESALKLLVQVRNKAIEAYHEIMKLQA